MPKKGSDPKDEHQDHNLEQEIEEAEEKKGQAGEGQNINFHQNNNKETDEKRPGQESGYSDIQKPSTEYVDLQEFYVKNEEDFDKVESAVKEIKSQEPSMSRIDDSDIYELEPETKKIKLRRMPRNTLDMLKQKGIVIDYYKVL